jgi:adsorption protein B
MWLVDIFSTYLFGLKYLSIFIAICIAISSFDDLIIDVVYWVRHIWRHFTIFRRHKYLEANQLYLPAEKPLAIMIPAWNETGVIGNMAQLAATTLDYENYHIFVGTYPNDPDTQRDVDEVCAHFPNIHKVVCARPGPTSKADCLNNVLDAIFQFELRANLQFSGFILHDSEDVISSMELRLFNYLVDKKDLIQVPVYPFERQWTNFTSMSYLDEFAEVHGKDITVREAIAEQVPSAGVGTCFSRRAVLALVEDGDGIAFDTQSLTEDYDIGFRLKEKGMKEIFVRFPVVDTSKKTWQLSRVFGQAYRASQVICVREYFPDTVGTAVRQKARWIIGIVFQGYFTHNWSKTDWILNYFLWRDRKGVITNFVSFIAMIILVQLGMLWLYQNLWPDAYLFLSIFENDTFLKAILWLNLYFMLNRMAQRVYFVSIYYGLIQGLLSIPRLFWGNYINFLANWHAIRRIVKEGNPHRVAWDKTTHDFPSLGEQNRARRMIGQILIEQQCLTHAQLEQALIHKVRGVKIGTWLVHEGLITAEDLARAIAEQGRVGYESIDAYQIDPLIIEKVSDNIALQYAVLPLRLEDKTLTLACESVIDPISLAALARKLKCKIKYVIAPLGQVTVGLRHWYARHRGEDPRALLDHARQTGQITELQASEIWAYFTSHQLLFAEILLSLGRIDTASLSAILLQHAKTDENLGSFLVSRNIVSKETLENALLIQKEIQPTMQSLIDKATHIDQTSPSAQATS